MEKINSLCNFIDQSITPYHTIEQISKYLDANHFIKLDDNKPWVLKPGGSYYIVKDQSSLIGFKIGLKMDNFKIVASHNDTPGFKVKPNGFINTKNYFQLNTEVYGGPIYMTWLDRLLGIAGRVLVKNDDKIISQLVTLNQKVIIPSVAIHFNREVNKGIELNPQIDLLPLVSTINNKLTFDEWLTSQLNIKPNMVLAHDLYLYNLDKAKTWGIDNAFLSAPRIDNLECAYATLVGFLTSNNIQGINVYACFNNEEIGSLTKQGASSTFLKETLERISYNIGKTTEDYYCMLANSVIVSADNAHAQHPNRPEKTDSVNYAKMNEGIVIKYSARQSYTTDAVSSSLFQSILKDELIPYQSFTNRSDERGGGTLGAISSSQVSITSIDIGLAQLAMHSAYETSGTKDFTYLIKAIKAFYEASFSKKDEGWLLK